MKKWLRWVGTLAVVGALGYVATRLPGMSWDAFRHAAARIGGLGLLASFGCFCLQQFGAMARLYFLLPAESRPRFPTVACAVALGQAANAFLPARAGDAVKAVMLSESRGGHGSIATSGGSVLAERLVDIAAILFVGVVTGGFAEIDLPMPSTNTFVALAATAAFLAIVLALAFRRWREGTRTFFRQLGKGIGGLGRPAALVPAFAVSLVGWFAEGGSFAILATLLGHPLTLAQGVYVLLVLSVGTAIPVSVGQVGPFEAAIVFALGHFGVDSASALALAIVHHSMQTACVALFGLVALAVRKRVTATRPAVARTA